MTLSPGQEAAIDKVLSVLQPGAEACLAGAAGTGKTTVLAAILLRWKGPVVFLAPTGKAAVRMREQTGKQAMTIHGAIFGAPEEEVRGTGRKDTVRFGEPHPPAGCGKGTLVVVDEASMVNEELANHLRRQVFSVGGALLWVGDHEQLPPVEGTWGAPLQSATATLTEVHRQALESPVLELATLLRQGKEGSFTRWGNEVQRLPGSTLEAAVAWEEEGHEAAALLKFLPVEDRDDCKNASRVLVTWTNAVRMRANRLVREVRGYPKNEVVVGETVLCTFNNHAIGVMNGESFEVAKVEECEPLSRCIGATVQWLTEVQQLPEQKPRRFLVLPQAFDLYHPTMSDRVILRAAWAPLWAKGRPENPAAESADSLRSRMGWTKEDLTKWRNTMVESSIQATWGYCLTAHKAQGSQWSEVGWISCSGFRRKQEEGGRLSADDRRRMLYTVLTRAESGFVAFMLGE